MPLLLARMTPRTASDRRRWRLEHRHESLGATGPVSLPPWPLLYRYLFAICLSAAALAGDAPYQPPQREAPAVPGIGGSFLQYIPKPGHYFAIKTLGETAPSAVGFAWHATAFHRGGLRHGAWPHHQLEKWGWTTHDGAGYGRQVIDDATLGLQLITEYAEESCGILRARIAGAPLPAHVKNRTQQRVVLYSYLAVPSGGLAVTSPRSGTTLIADSINSVAFAVDFCGAGGNSDAVSRAVFANASDADLWRVDDVISASANGGAGAEQGPGASVVLVRHEVDPSMPFQVEWSFSRRGATCPPPASPSSPSGLSSDDGCLGHHASAGSRGGATPLSPLAAALDRRRAAVESGLCLSLELCDGRSPPAELQVARAAVANLLGSITLFSGSQLVAVPGWYVEGPPQHLLTGVPSRAFFPRGFLWDEGFHLLVTSQANPPLARAVLASWLALADERNGYIPREAILGAEARDRVHSDFLVQWPDIANPPTLFLALTAIAVDGLCPPRGGGGPPAPAEDDAEEVTLSVGAEGGLVSGGDRVDSFCARHQRGARGCRWGCRDAAAAATAEATAGRSVEETLAFLGGAYPALRAQLEWLTRTQAGPREGTFRWRGARPGGDKRVWHHFASGLDDFPRGLQAHEADENADLLAWLAMAGGALADVAALLGRDDEAAALATQAGAWARGLDEHWDEGVGAFCERGVVGFTAPPPPLQQQQQPQPHRGDNDAAAVASATTSDGGADAAVSPPVPHPQPLEPSLGRVCHVGYPSLYPLLFRLLESADPRLGRLLGLMEDPEQLWSPFGLRALSRSDPLYGVELEADGDDYWRSSIWAPFNYLACAALRHYAALPGPEAHRAAALAAAIEAAYVGNVVAQYQATGFIHEHYSSTDGHGRGTKPFTGFSALMSLMVAGRYHL